MNMKKYIVVISLVVLAILFQYRSKGVESIEELNVPVGIGYDIEELGNDIVLRSVPLSVYVFQEEGKIISKTYTGEDYSIADTREKRQLKTNKEFVIGQEKVYVISEDAARKGIREIGEVIFTNPSVSDTGYSVICEGKSKDILSRKIEGYPSSSDYIYGMMNNLKHANFFGEDYKVMDIYLNLDGEGKSVAIPYLELKNSGLEITGMAIFNKEKMIRKIDMEETRALNMLREDTSRGILTFYSNEKKYININSLVKRKVKCYKENGEYKFVIDLKVNGNLIANELYEDIIKDPLVKKDAEHDLTIEVEKMCNNFIKKMKNDYEIDVLQLGSVAAAKYGRHKEKDWNEAVSKADIKVNVKVSINKFGRGDY